MRLIVIFSIGVLFFNAACVTKKKYDDLLAQKLRLEADLSDKSAALDSLSKELSMLREHLSVLRADTLQLGQETRTQGQKLASLEREYQELNAHYNNLLNSSGKLNRDLAENKDYLSSVQQNLTRTRAINDSLSQSLQERERKVNELEEILANKERAVGELKNRIVNALLNYKENDLTIKVKNGKVYVSLAEQLLFGSGSIQVDEKGIKALKQLAQAIKDQKDLNIVIEGHTDNVPVSKKSQYMQDNWDLSVMRATAISKILIGAGLSPKQITAAGRGEYVPLVSNDSPVNKAKNRRTEIIITPDLDELFKILENN